MLLADWTDTLTVLGPIIGVVGTALAIIGRLVFVYVGHLKERITQLEQEKESLESEVATAEARAAQRSAERDSAITSVTPLRDDVRQLDAKLAAAQRERDDQRAEVAAQKERAERLRVAGAAEQRARIQAEADLRTANAAHEAVATKHKDALDQARAREQQLHVKITELTTERGTAVKLRGDADKRLTEATTRAESAEQEVERLKGVADQLEKQIEAVANQDGRVWQAPVRPGVPPFVPLAERTTPVISILNLKGGVGKTTLAANIAGYLSKHEGKRVLLIDLDHQRSLSQLLLSPKERDSAADAGHTIQGFLRATPQDGAGLFACARSIPGLENCKIVTNADPRNGAKGESLDDLEMHLLSKWLVVPRSFDVRFLLRAALQSKTIQAHFDYVLLDCPPRLTTACISALSGSDYLLIPTQAEAVSLASVYHLLRRLGLLRDGGVVPALKVLGFVANMVRSSGTQEDSHERDLLNEAATAASHLWGRTIRCFDTVLRRYDQYADATRFLEQGDPLRLAIHYVGVRTDITNLVAEMRSTVDAECGRPPAVPA